MSFNKRLKDAFFPSSFSSSDFLSKLNANAIWWSLFCVFSFTSFEICFNAIQRSFILLKIKSCFFALSRAFDFSFYFDVIKCSVIECGLHMDRVKLKSKQTARTLLWKKWNKIKTYFRNFTFSNFTWILGKQNSTKCGQNAYSITNCVSIGTNDYYGSTIIFHSSWKMFNNHRNVENLIN